MHYLMHLLCFTLYTHIVIFLQAFGLSGAYTISPILNILILTSLIPYALRSHCIYLPSQVVCLSGTYTIPLSLQAFSHVVTITHPYYVYRGFQS